jgi:hypothetical protein
MLANYNSDSQQVLKGVRANNDSTDKLISYKNTQSNQKIDMNQFIRLFKYQGGEIKDSFEKAVSTHTMPDGSKIRKSGNSTTIDISNSKPKYS